jgi:trans-aconitate methyltransferase
VLKKLVHAQITPFLAIITCMMPNTTLPLVASMSLMMLHSILLAKVMSLRHAYDVIAVNFKKAFDKVLHSCMHATLEKGSHRQNPL